MTRTPEEGGGEADYSATRTDFLENARLRAIKLHRHLMDADMIGSAAAVERTINAMDAELARRTKP